MSDIQKERVEAEGKGRFVATLVGIDAEGEITYRRVTDKLIIADHTGVPDELSGQGVAKARVLWMIEDARTEGYRVVPLCPYVLAQSLKHPEWDDVIVRE